MPLICDPSFLPSTTSASTSTSATRPVITPLPPTTTTRRPSGQQSEIAKLVMMSNAASNANANANPHASNSNERRSSDESNVSVSELKDQVHDLRHTLGQTLASENTPDYKRQGQADSHGPLPSLNHHHHPHNPLGVNGYSHSDGHSTGPRMAPPPRPMPTQVQSTTCVPVRHQSTSTQAMNDTPNTTAPSSPRLLPVRQNSGTSTPRVRPTTLDIPGLTKSKVSPDGRIAQRDLGAKLVIIMVGLPARGKSYITKKLARYLNWLQHDTKIFNVGERRRVAAGGPNTLEKTKSQERRPSVPLPTPSQHRGSTAGLPGIIDHQTHMGEAPGLASVMLNGEVVEDSTTNGDFPELHKVSTPEMPDTDSMDQSANFFDPSNKKAALMREQCAMDTLDELLHYVLEENGSVGILDATNSTLERRKIIMKRIREKAGEQLNVLFLESRCVDENLLEANMRLKLSGPDYKDKDPVAALEDFKKRVVIYEKNYVPLGDYEEANNMPYIQMIDVGRKVVSHMVKGFLSAQANYYLLNFNLAPRQIWITRHGLSLDNVSGKIGGDSDLSNEGVAYARALTKFIGHAREEWDFKQLHKVKHSHFPPQPGDSTPPNPHYQPNENNELPQKNFCVWTSMLKRSVQTAQFFDDEDYDIKEMRMLDELNAGLMEGLTYAGIAQTHPAEYELRKKDKLHYRYPGPGGEGYLDIINRLRPVIVELERMTDHVLLVGHRSVARVLLAYFRGLQREQVADLDVPIGMLYCLEPKPYGVDFKVFQWDKTTEWFQQIPNFQLHAAKDDMQ